MRNSILQNLKLKNPKLVLLSQCSNIHDLKIIHAHMLRTHLFFDVFASSRIIAFCIDHTPKFLPYAIKVFYQIHNPNIFIFNALIRGCSVSQNPENSFHYYIQSQRIGLLPDNVTHPFLVKACAQLESLKMGMQVHGQIVKYGFGSDFHVQRSLLCMYGCLCDLMAAKCIFKMMGRFDVASWTCMIKGYFKCGDVDSARKLFDRMPVKNLVTWSTMISGYSRNNRFDRAVEIFEILIDEGLVANEVVMVGVVSACAHLGALAAGEKAYDHVIRNNLDLNVILGTAIVDMYARCGNVEKAVRIFKEMKEKDVICWTSLISGVAMHGYAEEALEYFYVMVKNGIVPTDITFTAVLKACSHGGLVEKGQEIFESMKRDYRLEPRLEHYGCMVDLLGRAGKLEEAENFIHEMPVKPNAPVWGALLGACRIHRNVEVGERVGKILIKMKPEHSGYYVLLSNIYARTNKWKDATVIRRLMKEKRVRKQLGYSLIEIDGKTHEFTIGAKTHPEIDRIERMWEKILQKIKLAGYMGDTSEALFDIDEEEKEDALYRHSEKLAIAYGIMKIQAPGPIRIVKNLRVCEDCHTATKFISKVFDVELIVRDRNRFHHFKNGVCSCMDYW